MGTAKAEAGFTRRDLLIASAGGVACAGAPRILAVSRPDPSIFDACRPEVAEFSILTWNVYMMPSWVHESPRNELRAAAIAATLLEERFDVLCLQKVFDGSARGILEAALAERYPFRYGPANDRCCFKLNSGVWILSRHPLADYQEIEFGDCAGVECWSRKGAVLLSGTCGKRPFRLVATHLQGEEGPTCASANQRVRDQQMCEIRQRLLEPYLEPSIPFLLCGDFGTPRFTSDGVTETDSYRRMLAMLGASNGPERRITLDDARRVNQLAIDDTGWKNEMDYVLVRSNGCPVTVRRERRVFRRSGWDSCKTGRVDLSYKYAVSANITIDAIGNKEG